LPRRKHPSRTDKAIIKAAVKADNEVISLLVRFLRAIDANACAYNLARRRLYAVFATNHLVSYPVCLITQLELQIPQPRQ
jgi:hypothetical protein